MTSLYHTPWTDGVTQWTATDMNFPLGQLDQAIDNLNNEIETSVQINNYLLAVFVPGSLDSSQLLVRHVFTPISASFAAGFTGSKARARVAPVGEVVFSIKRNGVQVGTCTFAAGSLLGVFASAAVTEMIENDYLDLVAPAGVDGTIEDIAFTLKGTKDDSLTPTTTTTATAPPATTTTTESFEGTTTTTV